MGNLTTSGLIDSRQGTHGEFNENSRATWEIVRTLQGERNWAVLPDNMKHAIYMIAHKMARIMAGNPEEPDHWQDIAGYATLVAQRLEKPIAPIDIDNDLYMALSVGWNCSREEAKNKALVIANQQQQRLREAAVAPAPVPSVEEITREVNAAIDRVAAENVDASDQKHF